MIFGPFEKLTFSGEHPLLVKLLVAYTHNDELFVAWQFMA
jgi:hypothetical protein